MFGTRNVLLLLLHVFISLHICHSKITYDETQHVNVCLTPSCVKIAAYLLDAIDVSLDPCEGFYEFACGNFLKENIIPDDRTEYGVSTFTEDTVKKQMKTLLEDDTEKLSSNALKMTKTFYKQCLDEAEINEQKSQPLINILQDLKGWPIFSAANAKSKDIIDLTELFAKIGKNYGSIYLISMDVMANWTNTNLTMLHVDQGSLGLGSDSRDYYLNDTLYDTQIKAYKKFMKDIVGLLAADLNVTSVNLKDLDDILEFERKLAFIQVPAENRRNYTRMYNQINIWKFYDTWNFVNWKTYFKTVLPKDVQNLFESHDFQLNVIETGYLSDLQKLIKDSDNRTIINYVIWRLVKDLIGTLDVRYEDVKQDFLKAFIGRQKKPVRWRECVDDTVGNLDLSSGSLYVRHYFTKEDKHETVAMVAQLFSAFKEMIKNLDWMDKETKEAALKKADKMRNSIGYPDFILNNTALDDYYKKLSYNDKTSYFDISNKLSIWRWQRMFEKLLKPYDKDEFEMSPAVVNAYYSPEKNSISCQYDGFGNLKNWWSKSSFEKFQAKSQCMIEQYSEYIAPGTTTHISGERTVGENVADNGGLKEAYNAYLNYVKGVGKDELRLPGLQNFTNEQMFFISYANSWCEKRKPESALMLALTDPHSPPMHRVNGVIVNSLEFAKVFKCKENSKMHSVKHKKCSVW